MKKFNAVVALGKNWEFAMGGKRVFLSLESRITALAAAELYLEKRIKCIIFSGGETAGNDPQGNPYPSEAEEMKKYLRIFFSEEEIPDRAIILEVNSFDTAGNAEEVKKVIRKRNLKAICLLTVALHMPRAKKLFGNYGIKITETFSSEEILKGRNEFYDKLVGDYDWSTRYIAELIKETVGVGLVNTIDPKGEILRKVTAITRHREVL